MKTNDTGSNILLTGCVLLANLDFTNLFDLALRTIVTGGVWLGYKILGDYLTEKKKQKEMNQTKS